MVVYRLGGPVLMEIETTLKLTDALRAAVMSRAQETLGQVPEVLSGHHAGGNPSSTPHAAYVTLPFVSDAQEHADGRVMGVAVVLPKAVPTDQRRRLAKALSLVDHLMVAGVGRLGLDRVTPEQGIPRNLRQSTWTGLSRRWASVTPVLVDRFPKRNRGGIEEVIAKSCEHVGLPRPSEVIADRYSPLFGVEPSFRYITNRGPGTTAKLYTHVTLTFDQDVRGPVLLGAGRYFGLGLMRPLRKEVAS
jgi:CRISPR-associated protein Csb2